jgi:hypothetical protein
MLARLKYVRLPALALMLVTCRQESSWSGEIANPSREMFDREVYPVLLMDCAYSQCHGAPQRFFRVLGPGRARLHDPEGSAPYSIEERTAREMQISYERTRSMLITDGSRPLEESPLLIKQLDPSAGGTSHRGVDVFGRNVYRSVNDPAYFTLVRWALQGRTTAAQLAPGPSVPGQVGAGGAAPASTNAGSGAPLNTNAGAAAPVNLNVLPGTQP